MNLVGKIFTVLIFVMSLVFATSAMFVYSTHKNWREAVMLSPEEARALGDQNKVGLKWKLDNANKEIKDLQAELTKLKGDTDRERAALTAQLGKLTSALDVASRKNTTLEASNLQLTQENSKKTAELTTTTGVNASLLKEKQTLAEQAKQASIARDEMANTLSQKLQSLLEATNELQRVKDKQIEMGKKLTDAQAVLSMFALSNTPDAYKVPAVNGHVLAVTGTGLLELSVGSDDGVKKGAVFRLIRADGTMYLGQAEVVKVDTNRAVGRVVGQLGAINRGDLVKYELSDINGISSNKPR
jgi:hypothetical protein